MYSVKYIEYVFYDLHPDRTAQAASVAFGLALEEGEGVFIMRDKHCNLLEYSEYYSAPPRGTYSYMHSFYE